MEPRTRVGPASLRRDAKGKRRIDDSKRAEMLRRVQDIVLDEGFATLTVDELATRLQCSKSTLYAVSTSKEFLVVTAIKYFFRDAAATVESQVVDVSDPSKRIAAYLAAVGEQMRRVSSACYADMIAHDATREIYALNSDAAARRVRGYIREGVEAGYFRAVHAEFVGEAVSLLIDGILHGQLLQRTRLSSGEAYEELSDLVLAALTNKLDAVPIPSPPKRESH